MVEFKSRDDFDFANRKPLGEGGFSTAWLVQRKGDPTGLCYVLKQVNLTRVLELNNDAKRAGKIVENCRQEFSNMQVCSHPNVVRVFGCFEDIQVTVNEQSLYCLVMEYCDGGDLGQLIEARKQSNEHFPEPQIVSWSRQLTSAVKFLHDNNLVHRDIKPSNIYLTYNYETVKLGDFGLAKDVNLISQNTITLVGTPPYYAPEFCTCAQPWTTKCDVWSLGVTIYEVANFTKPFRGDGFAVVMAIWKKDPEPFPNDTIYSEKLRNFVMVMLEKNADARPNIDEVARHPFLRKTPQKKPRKDNSNKTLSSNKGNSMTGSDLTSISGTSDYYEAVRKLGSGKLSTVWLVSGNFRNRKNGGDAYNVMKRYNLSEFRSDSMSASDLVANLRQEVHHQVLLLAYKKRLHCLYRCSFQ